MASIRYLVPYEVQVNAHDDDSKKRIGTKHYFRCGIAGAPPAYGGAIPGASSTTTFLTNFSNAWQALVAATLHSNYKVTSLECRAIVGYGQATPIRVINGASFAGAVTTVQTATPHGFQTTDMVLIAGVTTPAALNGTWSVIRLNDNQFQVALASPGPYVGPGTAQLIAGAPRLVYEDYELLTIGYAGIVGGEALPLYADVSVRRVNPGTGKSFRSRFSMTPVSEAHNQDGKLDVAAVGIWNTALATFFTPVLNGGSENPGSAQMYPQAFSRKLASLEANPFTQSGTFCKSLTSYSAHTILGTQLQRKVRLSSS